MDNRVWRVHRLNIESNIIMLKTVTNPTAAQLEGICRRLQQVIKTFERTGCRTNVQPPKRTPRVPVTHFVDVGQLAVERNLDAARIERLANQAFGSCTEQSQREAIDSVMAAITVMTEAA